MSNEEINLKAREYIITFKSSYQITEDEFKVYHPTMKVNENTTIKEIDEFFREHSKSQKLEVTLIELEGSNKQ